MGHLKKEHPQKYYLKFIWNSLFCVGLGTFWYERKEHNYSKNYKVWVLLSKVLTACVIINQMLAYLKTDLSEEEKSYLLQYGFGQILVIGKFLVIYLQRDRISNVLKNLLENNRELFRRPDFDRASIRRAKLFCYPYIIGILTVLTAVTIDVIKKALFEGGTLQIVPTLYPASTDSGIVACVTRCFHILHYWLFVVIMILSDCLCICCLIFVRYKFAHVQIFFKSRGKIYLENVKFKTKQECEDEYEKDIILGIKIHADALWCASEFQRAMGVLYGIQMCECISLIVVALVELVNGGRNLSSISVNLLYIVCVMILTACYMVPSGDITHQAAQIPTAIFHSGWERVRARRRLRALLVVAIMRAQRPVHMTAFGVLDLSYESYILVLRSSYSFFCSYVLEALFHL